MGKFQVSALAGAASGCTLRAEAPMNNFIQNISITALHGRSDIELTLRPSLNIIHGRNGTGKTTLLHILANLIDGDIERFSHLTFERIAVQTSTGAAVVLCQSSDGDKGVVTRVLIDGEIAGQVARDETTPPSLRLMLRQRLGGRPIYLPAFRSVLEATTTRTTNTSPPEKEFRKILTHESSSGDRPASYAIEALAIKTLQCRDWFGLFVPIIRFPSLQEVAEQLDREVYAAQLAVAANDREALSTVFVEVLKAIVSEPSGSGGESIDELLDRVRRHLGDLRPVHSEGPDIYSLIAPLLAQHSDRLRRGPVDMRPILAVYAMALENRAKAQEAAFNQIRVFERSVNKFFERKQLKIDIGVTEPDIRHAARYRHRRRTLIMLGDRRSGLSVLSSGERQILTLLFSATHMSSGDGMVLIDEPELSLNIDWQRIILSELMLQAGDRQIIVCTHAPEIAAEHRDSLFELSLKPHTPMQLPLPSGTEAAEEE